MMTNLWIEVTNYLPPANVLVKVILTNGIEAIDFVDIPINKECPFKHYLVSKWRMLTPDELNMLVHMYGC